MDVSHNKWQCVLRNKQELDFGKESPEVKEEEKIESNPEY